MAAPIRAQDIWEAIHRAAVPRDDAVLVVFGARTEDRVNMCVMHREQALALLGSITSRRWAARLLDGVPLGKIPVLAVEDDEAQVRAYDLETQTWDLLGRQIA
jgi:hypothetical protein